MGERSSAGISVSILHIFPVGTFISLPTFLVGKKKEKIKVGNIFTFSSSIF